MLPCGSVWLWVLVVGKSAWILDFALHMVACRREVTEKDWASGGLALRGAIGIPMEEEFPLLPAPTRAGWQRSPLSAGQAGMWLRGLLVGLGESPDDLKKVETHSCKTTCLVRLLTLAG